MVLDVMAICDLADFPIGLLGDFLECPAEAGDRALGAIIEERDGSLLHGSISRSD
jgi:hypothetical protein